MPPAQSRTADVRLYVTPVLSVLVILVLTAPVVLAQTIGLVNGVVRDTHGAVIPGAELRLSQALAGFERSTVSAHDGTFSVANLPFGTYDLHVAFPGFASHERRIVVAASVPLELGVVLELAGQAASITVTPDTSLVDPSSTGTLARISMARLEHLPAAVGSRGLESVLVSFPGFAQNANGAIHPRGAHNQMTFVIDGLPISDQLTGAFATALDGGIVQNVELLTGNVPAEFGSKVSGVAVITSRTGLGTARRVAGDATIAAAGHRTWHASLQLGGGGRGTGYFASATSMSTQRFLDQVSLDNHHNRGSFARGFLRVDTGKGSHRVRLHGMGGGSTFEVANLPSQQAAGQDQRQALSDAAAWVSYVGTVGTRSAFETVAGIRAARASLMPSPGDTPVTASQQRRLATLTGALRYSRLVGRSSVRAGIDVQRFPVREQFSMGLTDAGFNSPHAASFNEALLAHDLTRGGTPFVFRDDRAGRLASVFAQSTVPWRATTVTAGLRYDDYSFLVRGRQLQPRLGAAYRLPGSGGVLRASYNRNYQTPPNENLLLSSSQAAGALAPESVKQALGGSSRPIMPERQHVYEIGYQRALPGALSVDVSVYHKRSKDQQDNNNFFDTGIIFPTALAAIRVTGAEFRVVMTERRGWSGTLSTTTGRAISTPPFTGGLFLGQDAVDVLSSGPFAIDHDQRASVHGTVQYDAPGPFWIGASARYDSGLVCNPSDPAKVAANPDFAPLLPYVDLGAAVPRVRPRTIVDLAAGYDVKVRGARSWSVQVQLTNLTGKVALYNFQSVFVGTRLVQPRTLAVRVRRSF